jgi:hypothetical protein
MPATLDSRPCGYLAVRHDGEVVSETAAGAVVELRLLGRFVVVRDGAEVPAAAFGGRKVRALLRMLAVQRGRLVPLDVLAEWLWTDRAPADPPANLQVRVNRIRRAVGRPDLVVTGPSGYALTDAPWCVIDTETLLAELRRAHGCASGRRSRSTGAPWPPARSSRSLRTGTPAGPSRSGTRSSGPGRPPGSAPPTSR